VTLNPNAIPSGSFWAGVLLHEWWHTQQATGNADFRYLEWLDTHLPKWLGRDFLDHQAGAVRDNIMGTCGQPPQTK
jgi:hypothetical protein